jgi:hypothetical protein
MPYFNPLIHGIERVQSSVAAFKEKVRAFYLEVVLSGHACPSCAGKLVTAGTSRVRCEICHVTFDPTETFQRSPCCGEPLVLRRTHYTCRKCDAVVPSRFLFDETIFDSQYFRDAMRESRERAEERRERVRLVLLGTRSDSLDLMDLPDLNEVPGLVDALAGFLADSQAMAASAYFVQDEFRMEAYRRVILDFMAGCAVRFDAIPQVALDLRKDRARRFVTLVFMEHERELTLTQYGEQIVVERRQNEANIEG